MAKKRFKEKKSTKIKTILLLVVVVAIVFVLLVKHSYTYSFANTILFPLWYVALGVGVLAGMLSLWKLKCALKEKANNLKKGWWVFEFLLIAILTFFLTGLFFAFLNQTCDFSEPVRYVSVVEDTNLNPGGPRGITKYEVLLNVDGKILRINVPIHHYSALKKGDLYMVEYRTGAFNEPYYKGIGKIVPNDVQGQE